MTKQINKTIRSLNEILGELKAIDSNDVFISGGSGVYDHGMAQFHIQEIIIKLEEEYQKIHKMKGKL